MTKIAVALFHGIGSPESTFADRMVRRLMAGTTGRNGQSLDVVCQGIHWGPVLQDRQDDLCRRLKQAEGLKWLGLRDFLIGSLGDAVSYQPTTNKRDVYDAVHQCVAGQLHALADRAGHDTPLCVVAHSFGSVIASNYFYDLQQDQREAPLRQLACSAVHERVADSPLAQGKTLAMFITLGSPLALWSMRHQEFDKPIDVPSSALRRRFPWFEGAWLNFYDANDVLAYPLAQLSAAYAEIVADVPIDIGGWLTGWNPLSHGVYWRDAKVIQAVTIAVRSLCRQFAPGSDRYDDATKNAARSSVECLPGPTSTERRSF